MHIQKQYENSAIADIEFNFTSSLIPTVSVDIENQTLNGSLSGSESACPCGLSQALKRFFGSCL